jgi:tRNA nucleotidyltransferase (CCA-adding enzyme)
MNILEPVKRIGNILNKNGFESYLVGGCVRDMLLNLEPNDCDISTNAKPDEVESIFLNENIRTIPTGKKYGTITILLNNVPYEITTFRSDGKYSDGRRPDEVSFSNNIEDDLLRRDFTCNSLACNIQTGNILNLFNGIHDIENKIIRAVGNPENRFNEDALRLMRAIRFASCYNFTIESETLQAIKNNAHKVKQIAIERIREELNKILMSRKPSIGIELLRETGLLKQILPDIEDLINVPQISKWHYRENVYLHTLDVLDNSYRILIVRLAALLHDLGKKEALTYDEKGFTHFYSHNVQSFKISKKILLEFKYDNKTIEKICKIIYLHQEEPNKPIKLKRFLAKIGEDLKIWEMLRTADIVSHHPDTVQSGITKFTKRKEKYDKIIENKEPFMIEHLAINGDDLKNLGFVPGEIFKKVFKECLDLVMEHPEKNKKEYLLNWLKRNKVRLEKWN